MHPLLLKRLAPILLAGVGSWTGCATTAPRTLYVPATEPLQLAEDVEAYVWVQPATGPRVRSANRVRLLEGLWVLSDSPP